MLARHDYYGRIFSLVKFYFRSILDTAGRFPPIVFSVIWERFSIRLSAAK